MAKVAAEVGSTANRYQILGRLAVGGMAEIFLARGANATGMERYCVLKRILRERASDAQFVQMFLDEARLAAQLQHPNIASVYDLGMLGDSYFFTMEYVHGETVRLLLHRALGLQRPVPLACVLTIIAGTAAGLHHAHERMSNEGRPLGIVHRDVTPSNLMVSYEGNVKIVDFGVAKAADRAVETRSGTVKGKISYLSPEQCRGARVDRRSDLFSLGIVMWEMLTGARLYRRDSDFENMTAIVHEPPPRPSSHRAEVPRAVDDIVMRLLAKSAGDRFQTADEVVEAIEDASMRARTILSTSAVSRLMRDLFGTRAEPWLELDTATQPFQRMMLASMPLPGEIGRVPRDPVEAELSAVPDLSVSMILEEELGDGSSSSQVDTLEPAPSPAARAAAGSIAPPQRPSTPFPMVPQLPSRQSRAVPVAAAAPDSGPISAPALPAAPLAAPRPPTADPAGFGPSALLRSLAHLPREIAAQPAAATLLGVSAPTAGARPTGPIFAANPNTTVRDLAPPAMTVEPPRPATSHPSAITAPEAMRTPNLAAPPIPQAPPQVAAWPSPPAEPPRRPSATPPSGPRELPSQPTPAFPPPGRPGATPPSGPRELPSQPTPAFPPPGRPGTTPPSGPRELPSQPTPAFAPPAFPRNASGNAVTPPWRAPPRPSRFTPRLLTVMLLAAAIGAVAAWLAMRNEHGAAPAAHGDPAAAPASDATVTPK